ncbi:NADase-type glycan-binding domain-containing protein [Aestuariimicrobium ganziense]|uniref:NADase-type glycan-binding domain-containing protein n=1 Tax=Aestuariimicrobium ganziense TaxID=2773677 RepID=UPI001943CAEA|nr:hypothetical protein [Aestuariimicrobium ganziense]
MADDLPEDWFRPRKDDQASSAATPPATPADAPLDDDERYTDQFKPGYLQHEPRRRSDGVAGYDDLGAAGASMGQDATRVRPGSIPVVTGAPSRAGAAGTTARPSPRGSWLGRHPVVTTLLVVVLALAVGLAAGELLRGRGETTQPTVTASTQSSPTPPSSSPASPTVSTPPPQPWEGATQPLTATDVMASCTADPATDSDGTRVNYDAELVLDDDRSTAWRCNGDGVGQKLTFTFDGEVTIVGVGVVNGHTKQSGDDSLYDQYRRVLTVEWRLPDGSWFTQSLGDNNTTLQQVAIPPVTVNGAVTMTIVATSAPGRVDEPTRDAVLISQVQFLTKA